MDAKTIKRLKQYNDELERTLMFLREIKNILKCDKAMKSMRKMMDGERSVGL